jgi:RNA polymerase sigma-70 factor (ECF subfamily)
MPMTRWSVVMAAGGAGSDSTRKVLETLFTMYQYPLYVFVRAKTQNAELARDLIQAFFLRLIEKGDLADLAPERGRFRAWLCKAMQNFIANHWDKENAGKRGGGAVLSLDLDADERRFQSEPTDGITPVTVLENALTQLRAWYAEKGDAEVFDALKGLLQDDKVLPYAEIARRLGKSEDAVKQDASRIRSRYRRMVRDQLLDTTHPPDDGPDQLHGLMVSFE